MASDGTIYTSHWLYTAGSARCLHISDLIAKVIQLDAARGEAAAAAELDRRRVVYETEWQVAACHLQPHAAEGSVGAHHRRERAVFALSQPVSATAHAAAVRFAMPRPAKRAAGALTCAGAAMATCSAQTVLLQTVVAQAGLGSAMQLLSLGAQPVARSPLGCGVATGASAAALSMQSMMRVAAMEFGMVQWASSDVGLAYPHPAER